ncbi:surface-associated interspersed protein 1.1, putative [Plasmodium sp. DRC-Itaito]|nr:surface-associated interspersed protein 1.1, putative [Plasmodium sp. DRC-Itaito]
MEQIGIRNNIVIGLEKKIVKTSGPFEIWRKMFIEELSKKIDDSLKIQDVKECKKNCRKLNYWMDDKEEDFVLKHFFVDEHITSIVWKNEFEKIFINSLKNETQTCLRSRKKYPKEIRNIMGELEDYIDCFNDYKKQFKKLYCWSEQYIDYKSWLNKMRKHFIKHEDWNLLKSKKYRMYIVKYLKHSLEDMFPTKIDCINDIPDINEEVLNLNSISNTDVNFDSSYGEEVTNENAQASYMPYGHDSKDHPVQIVSKPLEWLLHKDFSRTGGTSLPEQLPLTNYKVTPASIHIMNKETPTFTSSFPPKDFPYIIAWILGALIAGTLFVFGTTGKKKKALTLKTPEFVKETINVVNDTKEKKIPVRIENIEHMKKSYFWKWINIIELYLLIIEDIRNEEWEMNKEDFLFICINEFMNEKDRNCLYNTDDYLNSTDVMIKEQNLLWNKWMERQKYMLDKWKEEELFVYLKNDWKREEDEYMKKIYKELLLSLKGDTYNMPQRQKIIWKRWIAKHPYRIREKMIHEWFDKLFDDIISDNVISGDIINNILLNDEYIYDISEKKKKLKIILWIQIYMCVLNEAEKDKWKREKEMFIDIYIDKLKEKKEYDEEEYEEKNKELIKLLNKMKKMEILNTDDEKRKEWKHQDWFKQIRKEWITDENRYLNEINNQVIGNYNMDLQRYMFEKHYEDIKLKWIDDIDNDNKHEHGSDWFPIIKYFEGNDEEGEKYIAKEYTEKKDYLRNTLYDIENIKKDTVEVDVVKKKFNIKTIIEIHMVIIEDFQKDEWEKDKGDFLQICFEEFIKRKEFNEEGQNKIIINNNEKKYILNISHDNIIHILQNSWNGCFNRNTYILDKWKEQEWFKDLKNDWKREEYECIKKIYKDLLLSLRGDSYHMSQKQKLVWRQWINKHLYHINEDVVTKWFEEILEQLDKGNIIDLLYIENEINRLNEENEINKLNEENEINKLYEENEKNFFCEEQIIYDKKKILTTILWIQIHMMVLEESKKDECTKSKEMFLDTCIDELKKDEKDKKQDGDEKRKEIIKIVEDMKKLNNLDIDKHRSTKWKKEKWFKEMKKDWIYVRDRCLLNLEENHKYDEYKCEELIDVSCLDIQKNISKWNWENIQFKWIDHENEKDWLKGVDMDEHINDYMDEHINDYMEAHINDYMEAHINDYMDEHINDYMDEHINGYMEAHINDYMDEHINDYMDEHIGNNVDNFRRDDMEKYINEYIRDNIEKDKNTNVDEDHIKKYNACHNFVKVKDPLIWKTIIEIQLKIIEESKREEWEKHKYDFLEICIQEYIKNANKDNNSRRNILEDEIFSMNKNMMWDTYIEAHRYILEKWKREEWFHNLKNEWNLEALNYLNSSENRNDESDKNCNEEKRICMIEKEKIIFRKWINKHTEELKDCYNEGEKNPFLEEDVKKKKKLILTAWIQIHMMIFERLKEDECLANKHLFIDAYIEEFKRDKHINKYNKKIINMLENIKKNIYHTNLNNEINEWKNETWFKQWKDDWIKEENENLFWLAQKRKERYERKKKNMNEYNIGECYINIHKKLLNKYFKYINFK